MSIFNPESTFHVWNKIETQRWDTFFFRLNLSAQTQHQKHAPLSFYT